MDGSLLDWLIVEFKFMPCTFGTAKLPSQALISMTLKAYWGGSCGVIEGEGMMASKGRINELLGLNKILVQPGVSRIVMARS